MEKESNYYDITLPDGVTVTLPRVTSILRVINKEGLNIWRAKQGFELSEQYAQETSDIGKEIHKFVAQLGRGSPITPIEWGFLSEEIKNGLRAYVRWQREQCFESVNNEVLVYSLKYGYAGTIDAIGFIKLLAKRKRDLIIADWKTGSRIWEEYVMQVAAYVMAYNEGNRAFLKELPLGNRHSPMINKARIVSLNRDTGIPTERIVEKKELRHAFRAFLHAKGLFDYYKEVK